MFWIHTSFSILDWKWSVYEYATALKNKWWNYMWISDMSSMAWFVPITQSCSELWMKQIFWTELILTEQLDIWQEKNTAILKIRKKQWQIQKVIDDINAYDEKIIKYTFNIYKILEEKIWFTDNYEYTEEQYEKERNLIIKEYKDRHGTVIDETWLVITSVDIMNFITERNRWIISDEWIKAFDRNPIKNAFIKCYKIQIKELDYEIKELNKDNEEELTESETRSKIQMYAKNWHWLTKLMNIYSDSQNEWNEDWLWRVSKEMIKWKWWDLILMLDWMYWPLQRMVTYWRFDEAKEFLVEMKEEFWDDLYVQLQPHKHKTVLFTSKIVYEMAKEVWVKILITNAPRYITKADFMTRKHKICKLYWENLMEIDYVESESKANMDSPNLKTYRVYSKDELSELSSWIFKFMTKEEIDNAIDANDIAALSCEPVELRSWKRMPIYPTPEWITQEQFLTKYCEDKLEEVIKNNEYIWNRSVDYRVTLKEELEIINWLWFAWYFLITKAIADFCIEHQMFGAWRGSSAWSLVAYLTGITNVIDPVREWQMFERFLSYWRAKGIMYWIYWIDKWLDWVNWLVSHKWLISGDDENWAFDIAYKYGWVYSFETKFKNVFSENTNKLKELWLEFWKKDNDWNEIELVNQVTDETVKEFFLDVINKFSKEEVVYIENEEQREQYLGNKKDYEWKIVIDLMEPKLIPKWKERLAREYAILVADQITDLKMFYLAHHLWIKFYNKSNSFIAEHLWLTTNETTVEDMEFLMIWTYDYVDIDIDRPSYNATTWDLVQKMLEDTFWHDKVSPIWTYMTFKAASAIKLILWNIWLIPKVVNGLTVWANFDDLWEADIYENVDFKIDSEIVKWLNAHYSNLFWKTVELDKNQLWDLLNMFYECKNYDDLRKNIKEEFNLELTKEHWNDLMKLLKYDVINDKWDFVPNKATVEKIIWMLKEKNDWNKRIEWMYDLFEDKPELLIQAYNLIQDIASMWQHAGWIIISDIPLRDYLPVAWKHKTELKTAFSESWISWKQLTFVGAIKFDVLKLASLNLCMSIADKANVDLQEFYKLDIYNEDILKNELTPMISKWLFSWVFQIWENASAVTVANKMLKDPLNEKWIPITFNDLAAMSSANRPWPMSLETEDQETWEEIRGAHEVMYRIKTWLTKENYYGSKIVEMILKETKWVLLYEEQWMRLAQMLWGYDEFLANKFRKETKQIPVLKSKLNDKWKVIYDKHYNRIMEHMTEDVYYLIQDWKKHYWVIKRLEFVAQKYNLNIKDKVFFDKWLNKDDAIELLDSIFAMAAYTFNSAHCKSYAVLTYYMLLLKSRHPTAYAAANLDKTWPTSMLMSELMKQWITIEKPNVNKSKFDMVPDEENKIVYWGMGWIKWAWTSIEYINDAIDIYWEFGSIVEIMKVVPKKNFWKRSIIPFMQIWAFSKMSEYHSNSKALIEYYNWSIRELTEDVTKRNGDVVERLVSPEIYNVEVPSFPKVFEVFEDDDDHEHVWKEIRLYLKWWRKTPKDELIKKLEKWLNKVIVFNDEILNNLFDWVYQYYKELQNTRKQEKEALKKLSIEVEDYTNKEIREIEEELAWYSFTERIFSDEEQKLIDFYKKAKIESEETWELVTWWEIVELYTRNDRGWNEMAFIEIFDFIHNKTYKALSFSSNFSFLKEKMKIWDLVLTRPQELDGWTLSLWRNTLVSWDFINTWADEQNAKIENFVIEEDSVDERMIRRISMQRRTMRRNEQVKFYHWIINSRVVKKDRKTQEMWLELEISAIEDLWNKIYWEESKKIYFMYWKLFNMNKWRAKEWRRICFSSESSFNFKTRKTVNTIESIDIFSD